MCAVTGGALVYSELLPKSSKKAKVYRNILSFYCCMYSSVYMFGYSYVFVICIYYVFIIILLLYTYYYDVYVSILVVLDDSGILCYPLLVILAIWLALTNGTLAAQKRGL